LLKRKTEINCLC